MSRHKGARLYLRRGKDPQKDVWIIRDSSKQVRTGRGYGERREAEDQLKQYIANKYQPSRQSARDPASVSVADVLNIYAKDVGPTVRRPGELGQRILALLSFFQTRTRNEVNGSLCRDYVAGRGSASMARRELEDLRAAINHQRKEGLCNAIVEVTLPPRSQSRERWLTRDEAAKMIRAAWRYREVQKGSKTQRRTRQHIARFILVAVYTGTRSGAILGAAIRPTIGRGYVDLGQKLFYRRARGSTETKKRQPTIRIPDRLLAHLRRWERLGISKSFVVEFTGRAVKSVKKAFAKTAELVGFKDVTPHTLRHTAVTWAMMKGADLTTHRTSSA
jgi:integrase